MSATDGPSDTFAALFESQGSQQQRRRFHPGENLEVRLKRGEAMGLDRALVEFTALADGLAYAHARGIHHRDIKAENVVVGETGRAVLVDFGVALRFGASRLTRAGNVMGTMAYLPPEVLEGAEPDPASSDQYALGMLFSECLAGKASFRPSGNEAQRARFANLVTEKGNPLDPGPPFPEKVRAVIRRATHPEPADRFESMAAFAKAIESLVPKGRRAELDRRLLRPVSTWSRNLVIGGVLVALGALLAAFALGAAFILVLLLWLASP